MLSDSNFVLTAPGASSIPSGYLPRVYIKDISNSEAKNNVLNLPEVANLSKTSLEHEKLHPIARAL